MQTDKATPRPWKATFDNTYIDSESAGERIASLTGSRERQESNAALIVKAVNNHDALLEACKEVLHWVEGGAEADLLEVAKRVLSKAINQATK